MSSTTSSEFRQRGFQRGGNSNSLPRPQAGSPRSSPANSRSVNAGGVPPPPPNPGYAGQRSSSFSNVGSSNSRRPSYNTSGAFNPTASSTPFNGGYSGGYSGGYAAASSNNGYDNSNGYGSTSSNRRSDDDNKYAKKPKRKGQGAGLPPLGFVIGGMILFLYASVMTVMYYSKRSEQNRMYDLIGASDTTSALSSYKDLQRKLENAERSKNTAENMARSKVQGEINRLHREKNVARSEAEEAFNELLPEAQKKLEVHGVREDAFKDQVEWLMDRTRRESKRMVLERFGAGPHKVEITYEIKTDVNNESSPKTQYSFVIEMAPLEFVPHAIHLFLEQVEHGLLDGTHFYLNGPHIVQSGPQPDWNEMDGDNDDSVNTEVAEVDRISGSAVDTIEKYERKVARKKLTFDDDNYEPYYTTDELYEEDKRTKKFQDLGLDELAFPDYDRRFPHVPWSVGFTGRPGGPDWYINKVDNTEGHGPGGQAQHALHEQGDSCFGTISIEGSGRDSLAASVYQADVYGDSSEWHYFINNPIQVVSAKILTKNPILDRHLHLDHLHSQHKVYDHRRRDNSNGPQLPEIRFGQGVHPPQKGQDTSVNKNGQAGHTGHQPHMHGAAEA